MIDVSQWRASIGLWNYCQAASSRPANGRHSHSFKAAVDSKSGSTTSGEKTSKLPAALSLIALLLLLFLSLFLLRHILMIPPTGNCYQVQCTTGVTVTDTNYLLSVVLPGGSSSNLIQNDLYLIVCLRKLLLLSGDVELNPGPMIDDRPTVPLLIQWLEPLVDWQSFACCLPGITQHDTLKIEADYSKVNDRKRELYSKWLDVYPEATWNDVITALKIRRENTLAQNVREMIERQPSVLNVSTGAAVSTTQKENIMFNTKEDEEKVLCPLIELKKSFASLMTKVQRAFDERVASDPKLLTDLTRWIETYMNWNDKLTNASLNETFKIICPFYDFIDCSLIVDMSEEFLKGSKFSEGSELNIVSELEKYKKEADELRSLAQVKHLNEALKKIYEGHIPDTSNMPMILIKLHDPWYGSNINGLSLLIHNLLPVGYQQSIMKYITISSGSVIIKYSVHGSTADSLIEYTGGKLQFMRLIGIFSLYINDHPVLQEEENMNFTFELALLEAVTAGNNEAVEFLLQLETIDIDHGNQKSKTALMLACERGHEDIVHSLLSAGANVNIQDNKGWTELMLASKYNHISIIHMLLQANANPRLKTSNGSNAVMIACSNGNYEVVDLLISKGVDYKLQQKNGWNALMLACENGHTQIVKLLLKKQVDPNIQNRKGDTALIKAKNKGYSEIVDLLLEWKADPTIESNKKRTAKNIEQSLLDLAHSHTKKQNDDASSLTSGYHSCAELTDDSGDEQQDDAASSYSFEPKNLDGDVEIILFPREDQKVQDTLDELQAKFSHIMTEIKSIFHKKVTDDDDELSTKISDWVEHQLNLKDGTVDNDLNDLFAKIYHYYDFIDCSLIVAMCNEFISDEKDLLDELKVYSLKANTFRSSRPITELKQKLRKVYGPYRQHLESMPLICIELQNPWNDVTINGLYILIERLLPKELRQSIMKCITIEPG